MHIWLAKAAISVSAEPSKVLLSLRVSAPNTATLHNISRVLTDRLTLVVQRLRGSHVSFNETIAPASDELVGALDFTVQSDWFHWAFLSELNGLDGDARRNFLVELAQRLVPGAQPTLN